jgi:hypothetical protein
MQKQKVLSDETRIGTYTWKDLKREAMRDEFDKSKKFATFNEDDQELIRRLMDAQKMHANSDVGELNPTFLEEEDSDDVSEEEDEGIKEEPYARVEESGVASVFGP